MALIAFITDFGLDDWYVGSMKGVALEINPDVRLVDITHQIPAGDISAGAFALLSCYRSFPPNTIFVVVVDPTVGSSRRALISKVDDHFFIGPDNGVLSWVFDRGKRRSIHVLDHQKGTLPKVSSTFHGRDVFTPLAARLSKNKESFFAALGPKIENFVYLEWPEPQIQRTSIRGWVVYIDRFGNAITSIEKATLEGLNSLMRYATCASCQSIPLCSYYQEVAEGEALGLIGSSGFFEISINRGNAARDLGMSIGDPVDILLG